MRHHPGLLSVAVKLHVSELIRRAEQERRVQRATEAEPPHTIGSSYRLADGSWLHLRHDSC